MEKTKHMKRLLSLSLLVLSVFLIRCTSGSSSGEASTADTIALESGVKYILLKEGDGTPVTEGTEVATHINLMVNTTGDTVWSTYGDVPFAFEAQRTPLIKGFDEVIMLTRTGDRILAVIPPELGYGARGNGPGIPPNATLYFDIAILDVRPPRTPASEVLYQAWQSGAVDGIRSSYDTIRGKDDRYKLQDDEWYRLSVMMADDKAWQDIIEMWDMRLQDSFMLGGYYYQARAYDSLDQLGNAIKVLEKAVELDSTRNPNIKGYLDNLKERNQ